MRPALLLAVVLLLGCGPDTLAGLTAPEMVVASSSGLVERSHVVTARIERGVARLSVRREIYNGTGQFQELVRSIALPSEAVVTDLQVGSNARAALLTVEEAAVRWEALVSQGDAEPSTVGLLDWTGGEDLALRLFALAPGATIVEYEVMVAPTWSEGEWQVDYPARDLDREDELPAATPTFGGDGRVEELRSEATADGPGAVTGWRLHLPRAPIDRVEARWAVFPLAPERTLWRLELDAAQVLEPAPVRPNVVFVIDASHSEGPDGIAAQLELLPPYLANAPDAQVEIVLFRRDAERLFGRFVPAWDVARRLAGVPTEKLAPGNGSNLELGAALAAEALSQVGGVGRVVLCTDGLVRNAFTNELAIAALSRAPRDTVVHLVQREAPGDGELSERRDDAHPLAPIAAATGGMLLVVDGRADDAEAAARRLLGLVRPVRIDQLELQAVGLPGGRLELDSVLDEGATVRWMAIDEQPPQQLTLLGKIWGRELRRVVWLSGDLVEQLPGLAIGGDIELDLSQEEVATAARAAHVVSRETSLLAAPPNAGPSTAGRVDPGTGFLGLRGFGTSGCSCGGGWSHYSEGLSLRESPDYVGLLRSLLDAGVSACARQHGADPRSVTVTLEATGDEVVSVETAAPADAFAACVTEAAWAVRLPEVFVSHRTWVVAMSPR